MVRLLVRANFQHNFGMGNTGKILVFKLKLITIVITQNRSVKLRINIESLIKVGRKGGLPTTAGRTILSANVGFGRRVYS